MGAVVSARQRSCRACQGQPSWKFVLRVGAFILSKSVQAQPSIVQDLRAVLVPDSGFVLLCKAEEDELQVLVSGVEKEARIGSLLTEDTEISTYDSGGLNFPVPLGYTLTVDEHGVVSVSSKGAYHGEAETMVIRMLCTTANCIIPRDVGNRCLRPGRNHVPSGGPAPDSREAGIFGVTGTASGHCVGTQCHPAQAQSSMHLHAPASSSLASGPGRGLTNTCVTTCLVDSADADVLMIILSCWHDIPSSVREGIVFKKGHKCMLVRCIVEDAAAENSSISPMLLAVASCAAGADFAPGTNGVNHNVYLRAAWFNAAYIGDIALPGRDVSSALGNSKIRRFESQVELLTILAYLRKAGIISFLNNEEASRRQSLLLESMSTQQSGN